MHASFPTNEGMVGLRARACSRVGQSTRFEGGRFAQVKWGPKDAKGNVWSTCRRQVTDKVEVVTDPPMCNANKKFTERRKDFLGSPCSWEQGCCVQPLAIR